MMNGKGRRKQKLTILVSFEPSRLGRAALEKAYELVAPIHGMAQREPTGAAVVSTGAGTAGQEE